MTETGGESDTGRVEQTKPGGTPGGMPAAALTVPVEQAEGYRHLAASAALLGSGLEELAQAAMMLGVLDPESLGAVGADWPNVENLGTVLRAWAVLVAGNLPSPERQPSGGLFVIERKLDLP